MVRTEFWQLDFFVLSVDEGLDGHLFQETDSIVKLF